MYTKWYSNGLIAEKTEELRKDFAKIESPIYGVNDRDTLALHFLLIYASGRRTDFQLTDAKDIKALLTRTKAYEVSKLEGKVIETFRKGEMLIGLSINKNLI